MVTSARGAGVTEFIDRLLAVSSTRRGRPTHRTVRLISAAPRSATAVSGFQAPACDSASPPEHDRNPGDQCPRLHPAVGARFRPTKRLHHDVEDRDERMFRNVAKTSLRRPRCRRNGGLLSGAAGKTSGITPRIERERRHQDRSQPDARRFDGRVTIDLPCARNFSANSTIRIEFFAASPISITSPIWQ